MVMSVFLTPLQRQPDDTSLYSVEGYCLDRSRSLVVERDGFLLLRFLLSLKRHDEKAETGSGILYRASRHPVASSTSQAGDAGTRYASLLQQGVSKMLDEEGLDEERKLRMQHWAKVAKDARALCLAVWFGVSANKAAEAYVLASAVASRSKPLTRQSKLMPIDDPHGRLDILFCLLERLTSCLAHCYEARMLAAIVRENLKTSGVLEEGEASQHLPTAIAGAMQKSTPRDRHSRQPKGTQLSSTVGGRYILPAFEPLPVKPFLFDLALQSYEAPDLRHRIAGGETGTGGKREAIRGFVKSLFWKS